MIIFYIKLKWKHILCRHIDIKKNISVVSPDCCYTFNLIIININSFKQGRLTSSRTYVYMSR